MNFLFVDVRNNAFEVLKLFWDALLVLLFNFNLGLAGCALGFHALASVVVYGVLVIYHFDMLAGVESRLLVHATHVALRYLVILSSVLIKLLVTVVQNHILPSLGTLKLLHGHVLHHKLVVHRLLKLVEFSLETDLLILQLLLFYGVVSQILNHWEAHSILHYAISYLWGVHWGLDLKLHCWRDICLVWHDHWRLDLLMGLLLHGNGRHIENILIDLTLIVSLRNRMIAHLELL